MNYPRLPLKEMSDIELLSLFEDAADADGFATSLAVAQASDEGEAAHFAISGRFAWLRRWGIMDKAAHDSKLWCLTQEGERVLRGRGITERQAETVEQLLGRSALGLGRALGSASVSAPQRKMLSRELRYWDANRNGR